jgi:hypothetical protein
LKTIVGIDFSLNSPAFCIFKNNKFIWGSLTRSDRDAESLKKNKKKPFFALSEMPEEFKLIFLDKKEMPSDYTEKERLKIDYFVELADVFWNAISEICGDDEIIVAMEGLSFASNGNALIDISMATALLRKKIVDRVGSPNFHVFSPTSIKKFAFKGNAKKHELYNSILDVDKTGTNFSQLTNILRTNQNEWVTASGNVNKPLDDIIDATWICLFLEDGELKN